MWMRLSKWITILVAPLSPSRPKVDRIQMISRQAASVSFYFYCPILPTRRPSISIKLTWIPSITEVSFSANPDVGATLSASAHLIPKVSLDLNVLSGAVSGSVFLNVDASLGLQGSIAASVSGANPQQCLSGNADINVGVSGQGSLFGLFDLTTGKTFDNNFPLFTVRSHNLLYSFFFSNIYHLLCATTAMLRRGQFDEFDDSI
jgi:hypothetical protein